MPLPDPVFSSLPAYFWIFLLFSFPVSLAQFSILPQLHTAWAGLFAH